MSISLNRVTAIGRLGKEPELRFTPQGTPVATFSIACDHNFTNKDGTKQSSVEWINIVCWNKTAENCNQYLIKGSLVYVEGRLQTRTWEGTDGQKHYKTEVIASQIIFLDKKNATTNPQTEETVGTGDITPNEIPF
jgi:single-strand DNA-binding protein